MANIDDISLLEDDQSPPQIKARQQSRNANLGHNVSSSEAQRSREDALRQELASVKNVNEAIEGVLASLEKAKANMKVSSQYVSTALILIRVDCQLNSECCFVSVEHVDADPLTD